MTDTSLSRLDLVSVSGKQDLNFDTCPDLTLSQYYVNEALCLDTFVYLPDGSAVLRAKIWYLSI